MTDVNKLIPGSLKPSVSDGTNLKPSITTPNYGGGTPSAANEIKRSIVGADGNLKRSLVDSAGNLKSSWLSVAADLFASVLAIPSLAGWWDVNGGCILRDTDDDSETTFAKMSAATAPVGEWRIKQMDDRSGNGKHLTQTTNSQQPLYNHVTGTIRLNSLTEGMELATPGFYTAESSVFANALDDDVSNTLRFIYSMGRDFGAPNDGYWRFRADLTDLDFIFVGPGGSVDLSTGAAGINERWNEIVTCKTGEQNVYYNQPTTPDDSGALSLTPNASNKTFYFG